MIKEILTLAAKKLQTNTMTEKQAHHMIALLREIRDRLNEQKDQHLELMNAVRSNTSSSKEEYIPCPAKY